MVTNDKNLADNVRRISNHGQLYTRHSHFVVGRNSRLDTLQAAILKVKLKHLDDWNNKRIAASRSYIMKLKECSSIVLPNFEENKKHVFHLFVIRCQCRDKLIKALQEKKISYGIHYPKALPFLEAYNYKNHKTEEFPYASQVTNEILSIPLYPEITLSQIDHVCNIISETFQKH